MDELIDLLAFECNYKSGIRSKNKMNFLVFFLFSVMYLGSFLYPLGVIHPEAPFHNQNNRVTHNASGRFGDQLVGYLHAKWIAYRYGIPILYKPFIYSDQLVLDAEEKFYTEESSSFQSIRPYYKGQIDFSQNVTGVLYDIPFFPESPWDWKDYPNRYTFSVDWDDPIFIHEVKRLISLKEPSLFMENIFPKDKISVAVHVRLGGGYDTSHAIEFYSLKFPPHTYYIEQLRQVYYVFGKKPLYVHIFTDDRDPISLVKHYQTMLVGFDIEFHCRKEGNHHEAHVLEDFFSMMNFDCLIRPDSNFSIVAGLLGNHRLVISPKSVQSTQDGTYIDLVEMKWSQKK